MAAVLHIAAIEMRPPWSGLEPATSSFDVPKKKKKKE